MAFPGKLMDPTALAPQGAGLGLPPQVLQIAQTLGIPPELLATPQGMQLLQLLVSKMGAGASPMGPPPAAMPAPGGAALPTGPAAPPPSLPMLKGVPGMAGGSPGADVMRRQDPYSMMVM